MTESIDIQDTQAVRDLLWSVSRQNPACKVSELETQKVIEALILKTFRR